ncbi:hypothetical protein LPB140_00150 [Sphingorhabdus lutea]|uniref:Uncharacterized protein n=1 Tax=Sphingorhabdus lutea TaxID=1913578 RepID=A0A1L3J8Q2_9SPHN|nr:hypothetical protein [Sphingorhabdus lutea]APG61512.1 hypothetical protein LPB140_00150 [Sphingorhabdus lutea]
MHGSIGLADKYQMVPDDKIDGHFRLYHKGHQGSWLLIEQGAQGKQEAVIAHCYYIEIRGKKTNFECDRMYKSKNLEMSYSLYSQTYHLYKDVDNFIINKLKIWENVVQ